LNLIDRILTLCLFFLSIQTVYPQGNSQKVKTNLENIDGLLTESFEFMDDRMSLDNDKVYSLEFRYPKNPGNETET